MHPRKVARSSRVLRITAIVGLAGAVGAAWMYWLDRAAHVGITPVLGILLAALLVLEPRQWPLPVLAVAAAVSVVGVLYGVDGADAVAPAVATVVGAVLAAWLLRVFAHGPFMVRRTIDVAALTLAAALGALAGQAAAILASAPARLDDDFWLSTGRACLAAWLGAVLIATLVSSWSTRRAMPHPPPTREAALLLVVVVSLALVSFHVATDPRVYAVALILVWAAVRFRLPGVSAAALLMIAIADWAVARDAGPLAHAGDATPGTLLTFQTFAVSAVLAALFLAAALDERDSWHARHFIVRDQFRRLFDAAPVGVATISLDGTVVDANAALCTMLGLASHDLVGSRLDALQVRDDPTSEAGATTDLLESLVAPSERRWVAADGQPLWVEIREVRVRRSDGTTESGIVLVENVTRRKELEEQVLQAQKMDTVGRLAGSIAHDFNNLLAVMRGHAELLEDDLAVIDQARERVVSMQRATDRAAALTNDLLTFSRRHSEELETIDVHEVIGAAHEMLAQLVGTGITIELQLDADSSRIDADPRRIEQVLVNLVVNASDAMPSGGRLTITTSNVSASGREDGRLDALRIAVADTGIGMAPHVARRIFEPFFTTKAPGSGTGLGLSTADSVVRRYGGAISVDTRLGVGTTFVITLPLSTRGTEPVDAPRPSPPSANVGTGRETILVVDDEPDVRTEVATLLRSAGYDVLEAADGNGALDVLSASGGSIDLLVSDVAMPGIDGLELAERFRIGSPATKLLFVSGYAQIEPDAECLRGATLLRKPVPRAELLAEVEHLLGARA